MDTCSVMFSNTVELICGRTVREGGKGGKGTDKKQSKLNTVLYLGRRKGAMVRF